MSLSRTKLIKTNTVGRSFRLTIPRKRKSQDTIYLEAMLTRALSLTAVGVVGGAASAVLAGERKRSARLASNPTEFR